jgi:hypothetical protein
MGNNILPMVIPKNALFPPTNRTIISLNGIGRLTLIIDIYVIILGSIVVHIGTKGIYILNIDIVVKKIVVKNLSPISLKEKLFFAICLMQLHMSYATKK